MDFPSSLPVYHHGICFDAYAGFGARKTWRPVLWTMMSLSHFLQLATPLLRPRVDLHSLIDQHPICPPRLKIWQGLRVIEHDGRHRAQALYQMLGNMEIPISVEGSGLDWQKTFQQGALSQSGTWVQGPLYSKSEDGYA